MRFDTLPGRCGCARNRSQTVQRRALALTRMQKAAVGSTCAFTVWMLFGSVQPAAAVNLNEWVPGLKGSVFVTERVEYESNIFGVRNATDDFILKTIPGLSLDYSRGATSVALAYSAEVLHFWEHSKQDNTHHIASGSLGYDGPRVRASLSDAFTRTSDSPNSELTGRVESTTNALTSSLEVKITDRLSLGPNFGWTHVEFLTVRQLDRNEYLYGGTLFWKFLEKAQIGLGYNHGETDFQKTINFTKTPNRDVTRDQAVIRLRGDLTSTLQTGLTAGYEIRHAEAKGQKSVEGYIVGGDVTYRPAARTTLTLSLNRSYQESTFTGVTNQGLFYTTTSAILSLEQRFGEKLRGNVRISGTDNDYPTKNATGFHQRFAFREDAIYGWGGGLDYDLMKQLSLGGEYSHSARYSNFREFKYADDKVIAKITLTF